MILKSFVFDVTNIDNTYKRDHSLNFKSIIWFAKSAILDSKYQQLQNRNFFANIQVQAIQYYQNNKYNPRILNSLIMPTFYAQYVHNRLNSLVNPK